MWQDGFLIDFLQKFFVDKWIRKFLIFSSYLFSERTLFKFIVGFYIDFILWSSTYFAVTEYTTVVAVFSSTLVLVSTLVLIVNLNYLWIVFLV